MKFAFVGPEEIAAARRAIAKRFVDQCLYGRQSVGLPTNTKACGQLLWRESRQRGLHGTAAAVRVLAQDSDDESHRVVPQLISYIENRETIELTGGNHEAMSLQLDRDSHNVIKISELLYGLSFVDTHTAPTEALRHTLSRELEDAKMDDRGWDFFTDFKNEVQLLPTVHAVRALASYGRRSQKSIQYIADSLHGRAEGSALSSSDISVQVFCLYVLAFAGGEQELLPLGELKSLFLPLWSRLEGLLYDDFEQNVEYSRDAEHYYVRVPYQLYLLPLAAKLAPLRAFASFAAQSRLASILTAVESTDGFLYPHSGRHASSRTNAIAYDSLSVLGEQLARSHSFFFLAYGWDRARRWLGSNYTLRLGYALAGGMIAYAIRSWWLDPGSRTGSVGANFVASLILLLLSLRKRRL